MSDLLEDQTVILPIICSLQRVGQRLSLNKLATQNFYMEKFNLRKLRDLEIKQRYQVKILNMFAAFENLDYDVDVDIWSM